MEKLFLKLVSISLVLISMTLSAQEFQGKAYYQTQQKVDMDFGDSNMSDSEVKRLQQMLKKQLEKSYILTFGKESSIYIEEEKLEQPSAVSGGGNQIIVMGGGSNARYYKNTKEQTFVDQQDMFGKQFLIKDSVEELEWKFEEETKVIGKYLCFKATAIKVVNRLELSMDSESDDSENKEPEKTTEDQLVIAWYTTDIPVSNGPAEYGGLPGLILELHAGETQIVCTKIVMNTKEEIKEPTKGKVVNSEEFQKIMEKKMLEMQERYGGREGKHGDGGNSFNIKIGG